MLLVRFLSGVSGEHALQLYNIHSKLVSFFQHALATLLDKVVKFDGEFGHAVAQVVESKIDTGEGVCH